MSTEFTKTCIKSVWEMGRSTVYLFNSKLQLINKDEHQPSFSSISGIYFFKEGYIKIK